MIIHGDSSELLPRQLDEHLLDRRNSEWSLRANRSEIRGNVTSKSRPRSTLNRGCQRQSGLLKNRSRIIAKNVDSSLLSKLKPRTIAAEKEQLYEENLALKQLNNQIREENTRFKTRLSLLEKELNKRDEVAMEVKNCSSLSPKKLANTSMKQGIREMKQRLEAKDQEILVLKRSFRSTRVTELETEVQAYIDECTRLKRYIEEQAKQYQQNHNEISRRELIEKLEKAKREKDILLNEVEKLKADRDKLERITGNIEKKKSVGKKRQGTKKLKLTVEELLAQHKKQNFELEVKLNAQKVICDELRSKLREAVLASGHSRTEHTKSGSAPLIKVTRPKSALRHDKQASVSHEGIRLSIPSNTESQQILNISSQSPNRHTEGLPLSSISEENQLSRAFEDSKTEREHSTGPDEDMKELLTHLSLRIQLHRLSKAELVNLLRYASPASAKIKASRVSQVFAEEPFNVSDPEYRHRLVNYLCPSAQGKKPSKNPDDSAMIDYEELITSLSKKIGDWNVLSPDLESKFDKKISEMIMRNQYTLTESCKLLDEGLTGNISIKQFQEILEKLDIDISSDELHYMNLLFYSHESKLDQVPYMHFIQAFSANQDESIDVEDRANTVKRILKDISDAMKAQKRTVREVFYEKNGIINAKSIIQGLKILQVKELEHAELFIFLESLAAETEEELCISTDYLEEILTQYGVNLFSREFAISHRPSDSIKSLPQFSTKTYDSSIHKNDSSELYVSPNFNPKDDPSGYFENISLLDSAENLSFRIGPSQKHQETRNPTDRSRFLSLGDDDLTRPTKRLDQLSDEIVIKVHNTEENKGFLLDTGRYSDEFEDSHD